MRILAPHLVAPYRKSDKNDANDAWAICEAVGRPNLRFVAIKSPGQQAALTVHRVREAIQTERTALINQIRGLLQEFGVILPQRAAAFSRQWLDLLRLQEHLAEYDRKMVHMAQDETAQRLVEIPGIGPVIATATVATVGDAKLFRSGRELAAWVGLVPRQSSSGGQCRLGRITKHGDRYLHTLFVQGALAVIHHLGEKTDPQFQWIRSPVARQGIQDAAVALAAKMVRTSRVLMARGEHYRVA